MNTSNKPIYANIPYHIQPLKDYEVDVAISILHMKKLKLEKGKTDPYNLDSKYEHQMSLFWWFFYMPQNIKQVYANSWVLQGHRIKDFNSISGSFMIFSYGKTIESNAPLC